MFMTSLNVASRERNTCALQPKTLYGSKYVQVHVTKSIQTDTQTNSQYLLLSQMKDYSAQGSKYETKSELFKEYGKSV